MKKITLIKNLEMSGIFYPEGSEVEVDDETYDWLIKSYLEERRDLLTQAKDLNKLADVTKTVLETVEPKRKRVK